MNLHTVPEVAALLRCDKKTVYRLIRGGDITHSFIGGKFLVTDEALASFVAKRTRQPSAPVARRRRS